MKSCLYSIKDELSDFAAPIEIQDDSQARRYFYLMCENTPLMKSNPGDFSIWAVGERDSNSGIVTGYAVPKLIERGHKHAENNGEIQETIHKD